MNGESEMRLVELETGKVLSSKRLDAKDFGEGVVKVDGRCSPRVLQKHTLQAWEAPTYFLAVIHITFQASHWHDFVQSACISSVNCGAGWCS